MLTEMLTDCGDHRRNLGAGIQTGADR
jgi:hypothetical protein